MVDKKHMLDITQELMLRLNSDLIERAARMLGYPCSLPPKEMAEADAIMTSNCEVWLQEVSRDFGKEIARICGANIILICASLAMYQVELKDKLET